MSWRTQAEDAIRRWNKLGLSQKALAWRANVSPSVITHVRDYPEYTVRERTSRRIVDVVEAEEATRIQSLSMEVVAYCHGPGHIPTAGEDTQALIDIKNALARPSSKHAIRLPKGVNGVLLRLAHQESRIFLVVLGRAESNDEKRALAHEMAHLRSLILQDVEPPNIAPKSAF